MSRSAAPKTTKTPAIPEKLWALFGSTGSFVPPIDDPGVEVFMVCKTKADAEKLAEHQMQWMDERPIPVRVK